MAFNGQITGNLGRDPELRALQSGQFVCNFAVAVKQPKRQGEDLPAFWVKVEVWGKQAEYAADWLKKGDTVFCSGDVKTETFQKRDGSQGFAVTLGNARFEKLNRREEQAPVVQQAAQKLAAATEGAVSAYDGDIPF